MKPGAPSLQSTRLLNQVPEQVRCMHYSFKIQKDYLYWIRFLTQWSATQPGGTASPLDALAAHV